MLPIDSIELRVNAMREYDFIHANSFRYDKVLGLTSVKPDKTHFTCSELAHKNYIKGGTCMYRTDINIKWNESINFSEELDFHLRLLDCGYKMGYLDKEVYVYRIHEKQKSLQDVNKRIKLISELRKPYK